MVEKTKLTRAGIIALTSPFRWIVAMGTIYLIASGSIDILRAWAYIGVYIAGSLAVSYTHLTLPTIYSV